MNLPIVPTIGRIVWYRPDPVNDYGMIGIEEAVKPDGQAFSAQICRVWSDNCVNLRITDHNGVGHIRTSVYLRQPIDDRPTGSYCEWMPYQVGQALKPSA